VTLLSPKKWVRWWWPALVWAALITSFSTDSFSSEHTSRVILPVLQWLFPHAAPESLEFGHQVIRKGAHVFEYFIFGLLVVRGMRGGRSGWRVGWALGALAIAAVWAGLDELHQAFVPSRGPSLVDVLIDVCGAASGQLAFAAGALVWSRRRGAGRDAPMDSAGAEVRARR